MKRSLQSSLDTLADDCLKSAEKYHGYSDKDMLNAMLVFSHFALDLM